MTATPPWKAYQEEAATFFRSLGLTAETDVTVQGARTSHDIDVLVTADLAGFTARWVVECKHWQSAVDKLHVIALRQIVTDLGADRGVILCEAGFQSGAVEAAYLSNVQVTSLAALAITSRNALQGNRIRDLYDRSEACYTAYWNIPKVVRIDKGLRFEGGEAVLYSGARVLEVSRELLGRALRGEYPIKDHGAYLLFAKVPDRFDDPQAVADFLEPLIHDLEQRLAAV